jgi:hypothetical protein
VRSVRNAAATAVWCRSCLATVVGALALVLALSACGDDDRSGENGAARPSGDAAPAKARDITVACDLTEPEVVVDVFGGTAVEEPGLVAEASCNYRITGGAADKVLLTYMGPASDWPAIKDSYVSSGQLNRQVDDVGDDAVTTGNEDNEILVIASGKVLFSVGVLDPTPTSAEKVMELGKRIADGVR